MKKTLYLKFLVAYILFAIFGIIVVTTFVPHMVIDHITKEKSESLYNEASLISNTYATRLYNNDISIDDIKYQMDALSVYLDATIQIINPSGLVIMDTSKSLDIENPITIQDFDLTTMRNSYYMISNFFSTFNTDMLSVISPITSDYKIKGYVVIHVPYIFIESNSYKLMQIFYITLGIIMVLSLIILIFFTEIVYIPIRKITIATEHYASGDMGYEFSLDSEDEMGYLAACLSYMASEIERNEEDQKKFIANVSHDFRSPLTSIKGYLEAMKDGTIPPEMYDKYLGIVLNETERLTKLTNGLLTLNNLTTKGMLLEKTEFDINQVIRSTASTFEGTCSKKSIQLDLVLTGDNLYVIADVGKIQQVLYNLLDNAIKFSHQNSSIKIETTIKKKKVFVSVKDSGIGIPKDDLKLIWDRFYKSDLSRGKDKKGTGLGLSITKEIIKAHDEKIDVISTEGEGTEFIFTLLLAEDTEDEE